MVIIFIAFIFRLLLAFYDGADLPGGDQDAIRFHLEALEYSKHLTNKSIFVESSYTYSRGWMYSVFLGFLYNFFNTSSHVFASFVSCLTWLLSALIFRAILLKLNFRKNNIIIAVTLYCFAFPTSIIYSVITLREVYILFFFNLLFLLIINVHDTKNTIIKFLNIVFIFFIFYLLTLLHVAHLFFITIFPILVICYFLIKKLNLRKSFLFITGILIICFLSYFGITENIFIMGKNYQMGHFVNDHYQARASYYVKKDIIVLTYSLETLFTHSLKNLYYYLFQPTISKVENFKDTVMMIENILRAILIYLIIKKSLLKFNRKILFNIILIMFMTMELIYSQVTINYGTASRHHVPVMGIMILLALYPVRKDKLDK
tara:strand:+ start:11245 stop:12366 length:1122 start_codon:yes stop_codon:yes gene_type:complete